MESASTPELQIQREPSEATKLAWDAHRDIAALKDTLPGTQQHEHARQAMNESFSTFILYTQPRMTANYRSRYSGTPQDELDIMQEVHARVFKGLQKFRGDADVNTWLYAIVQNTARTYYKREDRHSARRADAEFAEEFSRSRWNATAEADYEGVDLKEHLAAELEALPIKLRKVVVLRHMYNRTHAEIAKDLGITASASKVRLNRAKEILSRRNPTIKDE